MFVFILFFATLGFPIVCERGVAPESVRLWKTAEGQMLTWIRPHECLHFDAGGSTETWRKILKLCDGRKHWLFLSHDDREHRRLVARFRQVAAVLNSPHPAVDVWLPRQLKAKSSKRGAPLTRSEREDQKSRVFFLRGPDVLITGDSTTEQERDFAGWAAVREPKILVLGNHGRQRSTSAHLISRLPTLQMTWAASTQRTIQSKLKTFVYSGAAPQRNRIDRGTRRVLLSYGLPVLGTHDWGTLILK